MCDANGPLLLLGIASLLTVFPKFTSAVTGAKCYYCLSLQQHRPVALRVFLTLSYTV